MPLTTTSWTKETHPKGGRPPGTPNRVSGSVRDGVLEAGERYPGERGEDGEWLYHPGLVGYLELLRDRERPLYVSILRACIPKDIKIEAGSNLAALIAASWRAPVIDVQAESKPAEIPEQQPERE